MSIDDEWWCPTEKRYVSCPGPCPDGRVHPASTRNDPGQSRGRSGESEPFPALVHTKSYTLCIPGRLLTTNRANTMHWAKRAPITKQWRWDAAMTAREAKVPHFDRIRVTIEPHQLRGRLADTTGHNPSGKAALDGLIDARVADDDDQAHVDGPHWLPVVRSDRKFDYLRITIEEAA